MNNLCEPAIHGSRPGLMQEQRKIAGLWSGRAEKKPSKPVSVRG